MKIAVLTFAGMGNMGGAQVFILNLLEKLGESGHEVTLYLTDDSYEDLKSRISNRSFGMKPLFYETARISLYASFFMKQIIKGIQRREKYDLWQIIGAYPAGYVASALSGKVPLVLRTHGDDIQKDSRLGYGVRLNSVKEEKIKNTLKTMDRVIAMTRDMHDCYRELEVPAAKIVDIPNAINLKRFNLSVDRAEVRSIQYIPQDATLLITVGRYHIKKGHDLIPSMAERLRNLGIEFRWVLIGSGLERLREEINQKRLSNYIILKNQMGMPDVSDQKTDIEIPNDELIRLLKCADIFVFPTRLEGFPMVLIEAMAAGIPVVTTNSPGVRAIVSDKKTALLSEIDDVDSMVSNIMRLIKDYELRNNLVRESQRELCKYDRDIVANQYIKLYAQLVDKNKEHN